MGTHHGNEGIAKVGANQIAEVVAFSVTETAEVADDSVKGDAARTHLLGKTSWTGNITCRWDETDTNGQEAMTIGASITLNLYPEGDASTDVELTGTATIINRTLNSPLDDTVEMTFELQGNGALARGVVA